MKRPVGNVRPKRRRTLRALGGRRIVVESFGARAFVSIAGSSDVPVGAWISARELHRLVDFARRSPK